jgi:tetratricopeptide (TPR) repeat protein
VTDYFQKSYASMGGQLSAVFAAGRIEVAWEPAAPEPAGPGALAMASICPLLQQRRFDEARPLLEARLLLRRAVIANAGDTHAQANAQVALGLAALRQEDRSEARQALEAAIELEPRTPLPSAASGACW